MNDVCVNRPAGTCEGEAAAEQKSSGLGGKHEILQVLRE